MCRTNFSRLIIITFCALSVFDLNAMGVTIPAGSVDQLAAAIADAGPGGEIILEAGVHKESGTVLVDTSVSIVGEDGAVLETGTTASLANPIVVEPVLHIKGADGTRVQNLSIRAPEGATANCAILIEDSANVEIVENEIIKHQVGILVQHGDHTRIQGNTIQIVSDPESGRAENGVVVINGRYVTIQDNRVSGALMGIFISGHWGDASGNTTWGNAFGVIFCKPSGLYEIAGEAVEAESTATGWVVYQNASIGNSWGYIVIDGATDNVLVNNLATLNEMYDIELAGDSMRFGFLTPTSHENLVVQGLNYKGLRVKDCGMNNQVRGHVRLVDTAEDACF